jgi:hypothetical protein
VDGDDAVDFTRRFENEFEVDLSEFNFHSYFGDEGFDLIRALISAFLRKTKTPITIALLFEAAKEHRWPPSDAVRTD